MVDVIRKGYWDERIEEGGLVIYAYGWFTRRVLRLVHGRDTKLPDPRGDRAR